MKYFNITEVEIPIYRGRLFIIITNDKKKLHKAIPEFHKGELYAHAYDTYINGKYGNAVILNFDNKYRKVYNGTIAHEATHIANFIFDRAGAKADLYNDETYAYLVEWVTDQVYKYVKQCNIKITT